MRMRVATLVFVALSLLSLAVVASAGTQMTSMTEPLSITSATIPSSQALLHVHQTLPLNGQPGVASAAAVFGITVPPGYTGYPWSVSSTATSHASDPNTQVAGGYFAGYTLGGSPAWGINPVSRDNLYGEIGPPAVLIGTEIGVGKANANSYGVGLHINSEGPKPGNVALLIRGSPGAAWSVGATIEVEAVPFVLREVNSQAQTTSAWRVVTDNGWLRIDRDPAGTGNFASYATVYAIAPNGIIYLGGAPGMGGNIYPRASMAVLPNGGGVVMYGPVYQGKRGTSGPDIDAAPPSDLRLDGAGEPVEGAGE